MTPPIIRVRRRLYATNHRARARGVIGRMTMEHLKMLLSEARCPEPGCRKTFGARFRDRLVIWIAESTLMADARAVCRSCEMKMSAECHRRMRARGNEVISD
jgi:hypothetical protein